MDACVEPSIFLKLLNVIKAAVPLAITVTTVFIIFVTVKRFSK